MIPNRTLLARTPVLALMLMLNFYCQSKAQTVSIPASGVARESFNAMAAGTTLPTGWRVNSTAGAGTTTLAFGSGITSVTQAANNGTPTTGSSYNWGTTAGTDRAAGFMTSAGFASPNAVLVNYRNTTGATITSVTLSYKLERYRVNTSAFSSALYSSTTGGSGSWTAQSGGNVSTAVFTPGASTHTFSNPTTVYKTVIITGLTLANNADLYFMWTFSSADNANSQGIGLDDVVIQAGTGAAAVSASMKDLLSNDVNSNGITNPGDKITYNTTIRNTGNANATSTTYTNPLPANTTASGTVKTSALAIDDPSYTQTTQGGTLSIAAGAGVLANDYGQPTPTVASFGNSANTGGTVANGTNTATSDNGATVTMQTNGAFTYNAGSIAGFAGYDRFGYTATTGNAPDNDAVVTVAVGTAPSAVADNYNIIGNVNIDPNAAEGVLANDAGSNKAVTNITVNAVNYAPGAAITTPQGGTLVVAADGSFTYNPPAGYEGSETFSYTVDNPLMAPSTATVTLNISGVIWFVNNAAGTNGNGTLASPFNSLAAFQAVNNGTGNNPAANDDIFFYESATAYTGNLVLLAGQKLIGQDATSSLATLTGVTVQPYSAAMPAMNAGAPATTFTSSAGTTITLGNGNALHGFTAGNAGTTAIAGTNFGTLTTGGDVSISTNAQALILNTGTVSSITFPSVASSGGANGISLTGVAGSLTINGGALTGNTGTSFLVSGGTLGVTTANTITQGNNAAAVSISGGHATGTLIFSGAINATNGTGLQFDNADGTYSFSGTLTLNGGDAGIDINNGSGGTFGFQNALTLTNPSGTGLSIQSSGATVNFPAGLTVNKNLTAGTGVSIGSNTAPVTFNSLSIIASNGGGLICANNAGAIAVTNGTGSISATNAPAIDVSNSSGNPSVNLNFSALSSASSTSYGINLVRIGGTGVSATGAVTFSTAASSTSPTINISNSTASTIRIGTNGTTHSAVGINSRRSTGILVSSVSNTLQFGNLTIANPNDVGGYGIRIDNSSAATTIASANINDAHAVTQQSNGTYYPGTTEGDGDGIFLKSNTGSFTLNGGTISNSGNDGMDIRDCQNLALANVTINGAGTEGSSTLFGENGGQIIQAINLTGTNTITGSTLTGFTSFQRGCLYWINNSSAASTLTLHGVSITNPTGATNPNNAVFVRGDGTANMHLIVGGNTNSATTNCLFSNLYGAGIDLAAGDPTAGSTATCNLTLKYSTFQNTPNGGQNNIAARNFEGGRCTAVIENNTFDNVARTLSDTRGVIDLGGDALLAGNLVSFTVKNNTISNIGSTTACLSPASALPCHGERAIDIFIDDNSNVSGTILVEGNTITSVQRAGIILDVGSTFNGASFTGKVINNTVGTDAARVGLGNALSAGGESGIRIENRNSSAKKMNVLVSGNSVRNGNGGNGSSLNTSGLFLRAQNTANLQATVTGNNIETSSSVAQEFRADANNSASGTATICIDVTGNTLAAGAGTMVLNQVQGVLNNKQSGTAALASSNGISPGNVTTSGTVNYNVTCDAAP